MIKLLEAESKYIMSYKNYDVIDFGHTKERTQERFPYLTDPVLKDRVFQAIKGISKYDLDTQLDNSFVIVSVGDGYKIPCIVMPSRKKKDTLVLGLITLLAPHMTPKDEDIKVLVEKEGYCHLFDKVEGALFSYTEGKDGNIISSFIEIKVP